MKCNWTKSLLISLCFLPITFWTLKRLSWKNKINKTSSSSHRVSSLMSFTFCQVKLKVIKTVTPIHTDSVSFPCRPQSANAEKVVKCWIELRAEGMFCAFHEQPCSHHTQSFESLFIWHLSRLVQLFVYFWGYFSVWLLHLSGKNLSTVKNKSYYLTVVVTSSLLMLL